MKIYDHLGLPNPARIRIALAEKGVMSGVEFVPIDVMKKEHRTPAFLLKNPSATVPLLELDDGTTISDCTAITEYIDHAYEGIALTGRGAKERAVVHMMQRRVEQMVLDAAAAYFHHATPGLGDVELYQIKDWGLKQRERTETGLLYFDQLLGKQAFVAGANFSMADISLYTGLLYVDFATITIPAEFSHLHAWRARMQQRPSMAS